MLRHIVLFALDGFPTPGDKQRHLLRIKTSLEVLPKEIESLNSLTVRLNVNHEEEYDFALEADFNCENCLKAYQEHPLHQRVIDDFVKPYIKSRACVDYIY
ncbi:MAG: Dabb family protein [Porphyromonas sp.]|nr:Dabb family protein [Porphyromonas sp.]